MIESTTPSKYESPEHLALLSEDQAANLLGASKLWLYRRRLAGDGPAFVKLGRKVRYRRSDLDQFISENVRTSTSEYAA